MKDYLNEELTKDEKNEIIGIIWKVAKKYKMILNKKRTCELIDDLDLKTEDEYEVFKTKLLDLNELLFPFSETEKTILVNKLNEILDDMEFFTLKRALTFNEKLVFALFYVERMTQTASAKLLNVQRKTIYNRCKSIDKKIQDMKGDLNNGRKIQ